MATRKTPPSSNGKSSKEKFGDYMNARDVTGKNRGDNRAATIKKRANDLMSARGLTGARTASPAAKKSAGSEGPKKSGPVPKKRPVRGGGSLQGDLKKFGDALKRNAVTTKRAKSATSSKAKQITKRVSKGY